MGQGEKGTAGRGARVSDFFYKEPKSKTFFFLFVFGGCLGGRGCRGGGGMMKRQTDRPNQFASSTSLKLGAKQCINVQVMARTSSIYDHCFI